LGQNLFFCPFSCEFWATKLALFKLFGISAGIICKRQEKARENLEPVFTAGRAGFTRKLFAVNTDF
jgi:hypothetical protein